MSAPVDLTRETLITLAQAARRFPAYRQGRPVCASTIWRWCRKGVTVPSVGIVRLECVRLSGRWLTSIQAISRFVARQTPMMDEITTPPPRSPDKRHRAAEQAAAELERLGM